MYSLQPPTRATLRPSQPRGFTIVEMMLVLAVLLVVAALTWPAVDRLYQEHHLRQAADLVRIRMTSARIHAVDAGIPYQFRYEPGGRRFIILPAEQNAEGATDWKESGIVAERVIFDEADGLSSTIPLPPDALEGLSDASELASVNWSAPLLFFPDGTSEQVTLIVRNSQQKHVTLSVRQLTGGVTVSRVRR